MALEPIPSRAQLRVLKLLAEGGILVEGGHGMLRIGNEAMVLSSMRSFFTRHRLVRRLDQASTIDSLGNGYVITMRGRYLLARHDVADTAATSDAVA